MQKSGSDEITRTPVKAGSRAAGYDTIHLLHNTLTYKITGGFLYENIISDNETAISGGK